MDSDGLNYEDFHWIMVMLQTMDVGIVVLDRNYSIQVWNGFMENHSGLRPENVRDKNLFDFFPEIPKEWFKHKLDSVFMLHNRAFSTWEQRPYVFKFKNYRPITGVEEFMYQNITMIPLTSLDGSINFVSIIIHDVTDIASSKKELKSANEQLAYQSKTDHLTKLNNRGFWEESLISEFKRFKRYKEKSSLILCDIDHFKAVNDTYGHKVGDDVLRLVSQTLMNNVRDTDIAGRYGGEEFGIILLGNDAENAMVFAERFRKSIEAKITQHGGKNISVTISLGIAEFDNAIQSHVELIERADKALYESKHAGRNRSTIYSECLQDQAV